MRLMGFIGASGSGKTTLIAQILPLLRQKGLKVSTLKHAHHGFDIDRPGKDSYVHREAGAEEVMVVSGNRWALLREEEEADRSLGALVARMAPVDLLLVEGFKEEAIPQIEVHRPALGKAPFFPLSRRIVAVASDAAIESDGRVALKLAEPEQIAEFVITHAEALA